MTTFNQTIGLYHPDNWVNVAVDHDEIQGAARHPRGRVVTTQADRLIADLMSGNVRVKIIHGSVRCADAVTVQHEYSVPEHCQSARVHDQVACIQEAMRRAFGQDIDVTFNWQLAFALGTNWSGTLPEMATTVRPVEPEMVRCDCGHECLKAVALSASRGSSCPDCYDRMSE